MRARQEEKETFALRRKRMFFFKADCGATGVFAPRTGSVSMKNVLITGGAKGIGRACAVLFAEKGCRVFIDYNTSEKEAFALEEELRARGLSAFALKADVSRSDEVERLFIEIEKRVKGVDVLVNNAGVSLIKTLDETAEREWDGVFAVNVKSAFLTSKRALPYMISRKAGSIVNVSSMWGVAGASCEVAYSASKSALVGFTKALAKELGPSGGRVNCVCPGVISTDMNGSLSPEVLGGLADGAALGRLGSAEEVAAAVCFLAGENASFITGQLLGVDGGFL